MNRKKEAERQYETHYECSQMDEQFAQLLAIKFRSEIMVGFFLLLLACNFEMPSPEQWWAT